MITTHPRRHRLTRIALVTAIAIFSAGGYLSASDINVRLLEVARDGDLVSIEDLLDRGADIEARDKYGDTALMLASANGQVAAVGLLLDRGADIEARDKYGDTALIWASRKGRDEVAAVLRAGSGEPGGRQDTRPTLAQSQKPARALPGRQNRTKPPCSSPTPATIIFPSSGLPFRRPGSSGPR